MGKFGGSMPAGAIANCAQCLNKAEVRIYPNDNPQPICEDCYRDNQKLEHKIIEKAEASRPEPSYSFNPPPSNGGSERDRYIDTITRMASDEWVKKFTKDLKRVLINDWQTIIRNERWFSLLELRRFALEVDSQFDKPKVVQHGFNLMEESAPQPIVRVRRRKKEPANA